MKVGFLVLFSAVLFLSNVSWASEVPVANASSTTEAASVAPSESDLVVRDIARRRRHRRHRRHHRRHHRHHYRW